MKPAQLLFILGALGLQLACAAPSNGLRAQSHVGLLQADPKEGAKKEEKKAPAKKTDLMKPMETKAAEQGFEGKAVEHKDGKTAASDWHDEYGHAEPAAAPAPKKVDLMKPMETKA